MPAYSGGWHCHKAVPSSAYDHYQQDNEVLFGVVDVLEFLGVFFGWFWFLVVMVFCLVFFNGLVWIFLWVFFCSVLGVFFGGWGGVFFQSSFLFLAGMLFASCSFWCLG